MFAICENIISTYMRRKDHEVKWTFIIIFFSLLSFYSSRLAILGDFNKVIGIFIRSMYVHCAYLTDSEKIFRYYANDNKRNNVPTKCIWINWKWEKIKSWELKNDIATAFKSELQLIFKSISWFISLPFNHPRHNGLGNNIFHIRLWFWATAWTL